MNLGDTEKLLSISEGLLELTATVGAIGELMIRKEICTEEEIEDFKKAILESEPVAHVMESIKRQQADIEKRKGSSIEVILDELFGIGKQEEQP